MGGRAIPQVFMLPQFLYLKEYACACDSQTDSSLPGMPFTPPTARDKPDCSHIPSFSHKALVSGLLRGEGPNEQCQESGGGGRGLAAAIVQAHGKANEQCGQEEGGRELQPQQGCREHSVDHQRAGHNEEACDATAVLHDG